MQRAAPDLTAAMEPRRQNQVKRERILTSLAGVDAALAKWDARDSAQCGRAAGDSVDTPRDAADAHRRAGAPAVAPSGRQ